jgi:Icc-related predicted phosphoesterase
MLLVSDVHGEFDGLAAVAASGEPLLVLGDLLNFVDYRTMDGLLADVAGVEFVRRVAGLRTVGRFAEAAEVWREFAAGREQELGALYDDLIEQEYRKVVVALGDAEAYVTYGNVDRPRMLRDALEPGRARFVDADVIEIDGLRVGFAGGGIRNLGVPGEVSEEGLAGKLRSLGDVDVLCTHVAPAVRQLSHDVIGGRPKQSQAVLDYITEFQPPFHYFGDIHQPQAVRWRVGRTVCRNVGYFRATKRAVRHR